MHSHEATLRVKRDGLSNNLIELIANDPDFDLSEEEIRASLNPSLYVGRCPSQVTEFVQDVIDPIVRRHPHENISTEINL